MAPKEGVGDVWLLCEVSLCR